MDLNAGLNMAGSYYAATAAPFAPCPPLAGEVEADLVVVGGGCTGLSAALHAARAGLSVVVLEGGRIGWGASGRNGGQMIPGLRKSALELVAMYGRERARALFDLSLEARVVAVADVFQGANAPTPADSVHFQDGDLVTEGKTPLFDIDEAPFQAQLAGLVPAQYSAQLVELDCPAPTKTSPTPARSTTACATTSSPFVKTKKLA